jgi:hypothetical protein
MLRPRSALAPIAALAIACSSNPTRPDPPEPTTAPSRSDGGDLSGLYRLAIQASGSCAQVVREVSFDIQAASSAPGGTIEVQGLFAGAPDPSALELELLRVGNTVRGGVGTREDGVVAREAVRLWVRAVGEGTVTRLPAGPGEILAGTLSGYLAFGGPAGGRQGSLGECFAPDHGFSLRASR